MQLGVPRETFPGERRVALVPAVTPQLAKLGLEVLVEAGAGQTAGYPDNEYEGSGARIVQERAKVFSAEFVVQVRGYGANPDIGARDIDLLRSGQTLVAMLDPLNTPRAAVELAQSGVTAFAMELIPRITRAQSMDVLSSMATIAGYRAVLLAAETLPRMFPMLMTAAGTITPARVLVIGAGVAGLQAIATARRLGGVVFAYDVRPAVKEQIESLGARFVELAIETRDAEDAGGYAKAVDASVLDRQRELLAPVVAESQVVISTAAVPGKPAPKLISADAVRRMAPGSVIVDLAAERGGNCDLTQPGETVVEHGVTILGPLNVATSIPYHASQMYARNVTALLRHLAGKDGKFTLNLEDEITRGTLLCRDGEVFHPAVRALLNMPALQTANAAKET